MRTVVNNIENYFMMTIEYICEYCGRKCRPEGVQYMDSANFWRCDYHGGTKVRFSKGSLLNDNWHNTTLIYTHNDNRYHAIFFYDNPYAGSKFRVDKIKLLKHSEENAEMVFSLDFYPKDIRPENVIEKIQKYIIFS